jgi:CheY-like chemotaxis protein
VLLFALASPPRSPTTPVVLIVEDHTDTRQMYAEFLGASFEVVQAADGRAALDVIHARRLDAVVTDISLPGIDGLELIAQVRRNPSTSGIPVVCLSGYGGHLHEERAREAGCDRLIQKPCLPDALAEMLGELLREHRNRSQS